MASEDHLVYKHGELLALAADIHKREGQFQETHTELEGYVRQLAAAWESTNAKQAFDGSMAKWNAGHQELLQVLRTIAKVVEDGAVSMKNTDDRNAMTWL